MSEEIKKPNAELQAARQYLIEHGFDPDALVKHLLDMVRRQKEKEQQKELCPKK